MGQSRPVSVLVLVTDDTLEENLLATLSAKRDLALAALDGDSTVSEVEMRTGAEDLKRRLEMLLGARPEAALETIEEKPAAAATGLENAVTMLVRASPAARGGDESPSTYRRKSSWRCSEQVSSGC